MEILKFTRLIKNMNVKMKIVGGSKRNNVKLKEPGVMNAAICFLTELF